MKRIESILIILLGLTTGAFAWFSPFSGVIDGMAYDRMLRFTGTAQRETGIAVIAIDDESLHRYSEPLAMWHRQLSGAIDAAVAGGADRIGLDLIPTLSMARIAPDLDVTLMRAIRSAISRGTEVFLGFSVGRHGTMPEKKFALTASGLGFLNLFADRDGTVRRQVVSIRDSRGETAFSLAMLLAGGPAGHDPERLNTTYIDYRQPPAPTVSLAHVLRLAERRDEEALHSLFSGKTVLVGVTSPRLPDMHRIPATVASTEQGFLPGVHIHASMIQSIRHGNLRRDVPKSLGFLLLIILGTVSGSLFLNSPPARALSALAGLLLAAVFGSYLSFIAGFVVPSAAILCGILVPAAVGLIFRLTHQYRFTSAMSRYFRTYVNLARLEEIMANPRTRLRQENELRQAIARGEQHLCYQPKVDAGSGTIAGMEALVRWRKPNGDVVSPGHFIPLAEETGFVCALTKLIIDRACRFARILCEQAAAGQLPVPKISINLSARDLERQDLIEHLLQATASHAVSPRQLDLEITESALIHDMEKAIDRITALREAGFSISIDDFGTGHSSLGYITRFPFDYLKIDKSLVDGIASDRRAHAVVSAILAMAGSLGVSVVAEGVEDAEQLRLLRELGCDQVQGYVFSRPLEEEQMLELVVSAKVFGDNRE